MPVPEAAQQHYETQQRITLAAVLAMREIWSQMSANFDATWQQVLPRLLLILTGAQLAVARTAENYVRDVLDELGILAAPAGLVIPAAFAGVASDGRPLDSLLLQALLQAKQAVADGAAPAQGLQRAQQFLDRATQTQLADAERVATHTATASRPAVAGYVRMLNPPSCSRCVILAGRFYRWNTGFQRHPNCDCRHIPVSEDAADDIRTDPKAYFDSLSRAEQDKTFTKAGAEAIRLGADIGQVVNARLGMQKAQVFGRSVLTTTRGTRGRGRNAGPRLMPESILELATDRDDAIRLLKQNRYIT